MSDYQVYPFSALVGQESMKAALLLNAVDPSIGGVLIRGQKGTGKSTAARALANLLPKIEIVSGCPFNCSPDRPDTLHLPCRERRPEKESVPRSLIPTPLVDLPLSATEDRVVGTLNLERTLAEGRPCFEPGLMAAANRGILYVDEVNLLGDHLVDLLLDAAASGINVVERENIRFQHDARFMLVGSMNPEEGELRPQFLDRFGLCVTTEGLSDPAMRSRVVNFRLEFDLDPAAFARRWADSDTRIAGQIVEANHRLNEVFLPPAMIDLTVRLCIEAGVQGHRADIVIIKAARALAALTDQKEISPVQVCEAARFALPHRLSAEAFAGEEDLKGRMEDLFRQIFGPKTHGREGRSEPEFPEWEDWDAAMEVPGAPAAGSMLFTYLKKKVLSGSSAATRPSV